MLPICYICLRSDVKFRKLGTLPQDQPELISFCDQLCDYNFDDFVYQFCPECIRKLKRCLEFKNRCKLASNVLKLWKETSTSEKVSLNELYKYMPSPLSQLNFCDGKNIKAYEYIYQEPKPLPVSNNIPIKVYSYSRDRTAKSADKPTNKKLNKQTNILPKTNEVNASLNIKEETLLETVVKEEIFDIENDTCQGSVTGNDTYQESVTENDTIGQISDKENDTKDNLINFECVTTEEISFTENDVGSVLDNDNFDETGDVNEELNDRDSDSDASTNELLQKINKRKEERISLISQRRNIINPNIKSVLIDLDDLKCQLKCKFEKYGAADGNETILENPEERRQIIRPERFKEFEDMFEITILTNKKQMKEEFANRKNYPNYTESKHRCEQCYMGLRHAKRLETHIKVKHNESLPFSCDLCHCYFKSRNMLTLHVTVYHTLVFKCRLCPNFITNFRQVMVSHFLKHEGLTYNCEKCGKQYTSESSYYLHLKIAHPTEHVCRLCAVTSGTALGLNNHQKRKHAGEEFIESPENVKCEICNIIFINNDIYTKHCDKSHRDESLPRKRRRVTKEPGYVKRKPETSVNKLVNTCPLCSKTGPRQGWLYQHVSTEHPGVSYEEFRTHAKKHLCDECGQRFSNVTDFREHKFVHTGEKPFACDVCPAKFHKKRQLYEHENRHLPRTRECEICGKMFATAANLFYHMRIHTGDRRFKCHICDKGFIHNASMRYHIAAVHQHVKRQKKKRTVKTPES